MTRASFTFPVFLWLGAFICALYFKNEWQVELFISAVTLTFIWGGVVLCREIKEGLEIPQSWVWRLFGVFWLLVFFSILHSDITKLSLTGFAFFSVFPMSFFIFSLRPDGLQLRVIGAALGVIFIVLSVWALIQFFFMVEVYKGQARHPLANPNSLGALFNLALFSGFGGLLMAQKIAQKIAAMLFCILLLGGVMSTGGRGAFLSMLAFMPFMLFFLRERVKQRWPYVLGVVLGAVALYVMTSLGNVMMARIANTLSFADADISNNRYNIWEGGLAILRDNWLFGSGIGTFFLYYQGYRIPAEVQGVYHVHSDPLQFWIELGVLGPILFYALLIAVLGRTIQAYKKTKSGDAAQLYILVPFFALAAIVLHAHVTFNFYNLSILMGAGLLLGVWFIKTGEVLGQKTKRMGFPDKMTVPFRQFLVIFPIVGFLFLFVPYQLSELMVKSAREKMIRGDLEGFAANITTANALSQYSNYRAFVLSANIPVTLLSQAQATMTAKQKRDAVEQAHYYLKTALAINPRSASAYYYYGQLVQVAPASMLPDGLLSAEEYYTRALELDVVHIGSRLELAKIYERRGDKEAAYALLDHVFEFHFRTANVMEYYSKMAIMYLERWEMAKHRLALTRLQQKRQQFAPQDQE